MQPRPLWILILTTRVYDADDSAHKAQIKTRLLFIQFKVHCTNVIKTRLKTRIKTNMPQHEKKVIFTFPSIFLQLQINCLYETIMMTMKYYYTNQIKTIIKINMPPNVHKESHF